LKAKDKPQKCVLFLPANKSVAFRPGETVLDLSNRVGMGIETSCGGMGTCGACRIFIEKSAEPLPERNMLEQEMADYRDYQPNERLACQIEASDGLVVRIPED
jgi:ferredoxin, 2Fe-2S